MKESERIRKIQATTFPSKLKCIAWQLRKLHRLSFGELHTYTILCVSQCILCNAHSILWITFTFRNKTPLVYTRNAIAMRGNAATNCLWRNRIFQPEFMYCGCLVNWSWTTENRSAVAIVISVIYASHGIFFPPVRFFLLNCIFARTDFFKEISRWFSTNLLLKSEEMSEDRCFSSSQRVCSSIASLEPFQVDFWLDRFDMCYSITLTWSVWILSSRLVNLSSTASCLDDISDTSS